MTFYKTLLISIIFFGLTSKSFSQKVIVRVFMEKRTSSAQNDTIYYDFSRSLQWSDFRGKPVESYSAGAVTASGFAFDSQMNSDGKSIHLTIGVYAFFSKNDSWRKPGINSDYHLLHEQHHFDITRLSTEKFINEVQKAHFTKKNYNALLSSLFDKVYKENTDRQHEYDKETNHSINVAEQLKWNNNIAADIDKIRPVITSKN